MWRRGSRWRSHDSGNQGRPRAIWKHANMTRMGSSRTGPFFGSNSLRHGEIGTGDKRTNARDQPRLPFSSGSQSQEYSRRVETLRCHFVDDALSALNWPSGKRVPFSFAHNQMQDACVARVDNLACAMLVDMSIVGVSQLLQRLI